jgi:HlyD family secretion protein
MKKAAFVLALVMLLGCVSGCGAAEGEASVQSVSMICGLGSVGLADRFAGIVSPLGETTIKKNDAMTIDTIKVKVGDSVKKGDVLLTYDLSQIRTDLEMAQLELEQLNATLEDQQAELERIQKLMDSTYDDATKRQYALDLREQNVKVLETKANIATKKKDIEKLKANTADSTVKSPVDGEVQSLNPDGGTDNSGNALPFMTIVETGGFRIKGYVNENNASVLTEGTAVVIRSRVSDQTWKGSISSIDWNNAQQSRSDYGDSDTAMSSKYPFYVTLDGDGEGLLMGQHVYIEPDYGQEDTQDESLINLPSYFINDAEGKPWVWAQNSKGKLEKRSVTLGEYNTETDTYPVTDGLTAEDYIAYPDDSLKAGMTCITYDDATFDPSAGGSTGDMDGTGSMDGMEDMDGTGSMDGMDGGDMPAENDTVTDDGSTAAVIPGGAAASASAVIPPMEG